MLEPRAADAASSTRLSPLLSAGLALGAVASLMCVCPLAAGAPQPDPPTRALVIVRTLVIDGLGTRTMDTDSARVPFGSKGLMIKKVPYAGPALSFRLAVLAGHPQEAGIPVTLSADIWSGGTSPLPPSDQMSHREEATVIPEESSYLFEIDHDESADRRIVLSVTAQPVGEAEFMMPLRPDEASRSVRFLIEMTRESGGISDPPDRHLLSSMVGRPVTYSSGIKVPGEGPSSAPHFIGLSITLTAERAQEDWVTVKMELSGAEFVDEARTRIQPISRTEIKTMASGSRMEVSVTVPAARQEDGTAQPGLRPVRYRVDVIPMLGR